jgi:hypothetical protein
MFKLKIAMFLAVALLAGRPALGSLTIVSAVGGGPSVAATYVNFENLELGGDGGMSNGVQVNFTPNAQVVKGFLANRYARPFISDKNGEKFGDMTESGPNTTKYITTWSTGDSANPNSQVELIFGAGQRYLGLLWGSVDSYNTLTFHYDDDNDPNTSETASITGSDVTAFANGDQGAAGTFYVNINSTRTFNKVVMTSSQFAFEFDNVAYSTGFFTAIPEPGSFLVWGVLGLASVGMTNRRRKS